MAVFFLVCGLELRASPPVGGRDARHLHKSLIQIKVPNRPSRIRRFLGLSHRLLELLFQQIRRMLLRLNGLAKNGIPPTVLFLHGAGRLLHVIKHLGLHRGHVRNNCLALRIHFELGAAARAGQIEAGFLSHLRA